VGKTAEDGKITNKGQGSSQQGMYNRCDGKKLPRLLAREHMHI